MQNPKWWKSDYDSGWDRVKAAFRRDWEQTKHDMGSKTAPDLGQNVDDTVKQMMGKEQPGMTYEQMEPGYRFGYGAYQHFGSQYHSWSPELEDRLRGDYGDDFIRDRDAIRYGWDYGVKGTSRI